jgi:starch phosphorylase
VFLEDYDIDVARLLVQGVDVWLNNPRRPMEASGTSGMKAAANGVLNLSTLDGWWCEGYTQDDGWAIGSGEVYQDAEYQDMVESQAIYEVLENEVLALFYSRAADNLPRAWIRRMKNAIRFIAPRFNTHRMVADYCRRFYNPSAARWRYLCGDEMAQARAFSKWKSHLRQSWSNLAIRDVTMSIQNGQASHPLDARQPQIKAGSELAVRARVALGSLKPNDVSVELYHGLMDTWGNIKQGRAIAMTYDQPDGQGDCHWFSRSIPCDRTGQYGVALRILPRHPDLVNVYEPGLILWESAS